MPSTSSWSTVRRSQTKASSAEQRLSAAIKFSSDSPRSLADLGEQYLKGFVGVAAGLGGTRRDPIYHPDKFYGQFRSWLEELEKRRFEDQGSDLHTAAAPVRPPSRSVGVQASARAPTTSTGVQAKPKSAVASVQTAIGPPTVVSVGVQASAPPALPAATSNNKNDCLTERQSEMSTTSPPPASQPSSADVSKSIVSPTIVLPTKSMPTSIEDPIVQQACQGLRDGRRTRDVLPRCRLLRVGGIRPAPFTVVKDNLSAMKVSVRRIRNVSFAERPDGTTELELLVDATYARHVLRIFRQRGFADLSEPDWRVLTPATAGCHDRFARIAQSTKREPVRRWFEHAARQAFDANQSSASTVS